VSNIEFFADAKNGAVEALRSLARHSGLSPEVVVGAALEGRLNQFFDEETRSLAYKNGRRLSRVELRSLAKKQPLPMSGREALKTLADVERKRYSRLDARKALADMHARRRGW
jgi:hypothetical protein